MNSAAATGPAAAAPDSDVAPHPAWARTAATVAVPVCYLLAAALLTWRLWVDPASRMVAGNPNDTDQFAWFMRYAATAVSHGHLPALVTTEMNAPIGVNLMWNTPLLLPGVVLAPLTLLAGPQVSLTVLTTAGFAGSATIMFWVLRRWDVSISAAALAGAVYGFSPALLQSALGHYDLQLSILPPLIVDAGVRLAVGPPVRASRSDDPPVRWPAGWLARVPAWARTGAWLGLLVAAQIFIDEEILLTTALTSALIVLVLALSRPSTVIQRLVPAAAGLAIGAVVALALAGSALWTQFRGPLGEHGSAYPPNFFVNDLTSFVTPQSALFFHTAASAAAAASYQAKPPEYLGYLGWPLIAILVVAAVASWRRPAGRAAAITFFLLLVFSLGGHPLIAGTSYPTVDLPWRLAEKLPIIGEVLPDRLSILADGAAAALLAIGIDDVRARLAAHQPSWRRPARLTQMAVLAVAVACCLPLLPRPLRTSSTAPLPAGWSAMFASLNIGPDTRVLVVPFTKRGVTLALRWYADGEEQSAMVGGYFIGPGIGGKAHLGGLTPQRVPTYLNYLWARNVPRGSPYRRTACFALKEWKVITTHPGAPPPLHPPVVHPRPALAVLARWRPQAVVADATVSSPLGVYLTELFGPPTATVDGLIGWRLSASAWLLGNGELHGNGQPFESRRSSVRLECNGRSTSPRILTVWS
jgi:hypothetical protein